MTTLFFLLFCLAVGYVCVWVLVNERRGNADGEWGFIGIRKPTPEPETRQRTDDDTPEPRGWKP